MGLTTARSPMEDAGWHNMGTRSLPQRPHLGEGSGGSGDIRWPTSHLCGAWPLSLGNTVTTGSL